MLLQNKNFKKRQYPVLRRSKWALLTEKKKKKEQSKGQIVIATGSDLNMLALQPLPSYLWASIYLQAALGEAT